MTRPSIVLLASQEPSVRTFRDLDDLTVRTAAAGVSRMRKKSVSGVLIIREAYLANMPQPIRQRETNDASRTTDEAEGLF
jgi:hypothetical protein